ncbi:MAG: hypothetical protein QNJ16_13380 [Rhodobacter sp.]|nr:hypothetical protein [Rhodobacter sp.]
MGSLRRGLILAALPTQAVAEACATVRPDWDGSPMSTLSEALFLVTTVPVLVLLLATLAALRFRSQWGGLAVVVLWTALVTFLTMVDPSGLQAASRAEGCVGSPALFIAAVAAICVATVLYTAPLPKRTD